MKIYTGAAFICLVWLAPFCDAQQSNSIVPTAVTDQNRTGPLPFSDSYGGKVDHIDGTSGNLSIAIPIFQAKSRGMDFNLALRYEGNFWGTAVPMSGGLTYLWGTEARSPLAPNTYVTGWEWNQPYMSNSYVKASVDCGGDQIPPGGTGPGNGYLPPDSQLFTFENYVFTDAQGGKHPFHADSGSGDCVPIGTAYYYNTPSPDTTGQGYWMTPLSNVVIGPDGEQYEKGGQGPFTTLTSQTVGLATLVDTNGNQQTQVPGGTDTLNRQLVTSNLSGNTITLTFHDPNGNTQTATITLTTISAQSSFNQTATSGVTIYDNTGTFEVISSIALPNGTTYSFTYGTDGYLKTMTLPTGATITYTTAYFLDHEFSREYVAQRSEAVGNQTNNTTFSISCSNGASTLTDCAQHTTVVIDAAQKKAVYVSTAGHILTASYYDDASGTKLLKQYSLCYAPGNLLCAADYTVHYTDEEGLKPNSINTTLDNGLVSRVEYDYDSLPYQTSSCSDSDPSTCAVVGVQYNSWTGSRGNELAMREYDYGNGAPGSLIRQTLKSYLHVANPSYFLDSSGVYHNIVDKVTQVNVYDGSTPCSGGQSCSANLLAQTTYGYDEDGAGYLGRVTSVAKWVNLPQSTTLTTHYQYDSHGNITQITDAKGNATTWSYADNWNAPGSQCLPASGSAAFPTSETDALGHVTKVSYYPCSGSVASFQNPNDLAAGRVGTTFTYDLMNRLVSSSMPDGGLATTTYNDQALTVDSKVYQTSSLAVEKFSVLDGLGRTTQTQLLSDPQGAVYVDTSYDPLGRAFSVSNPYRSTAEATYGIHTSFFDGLGRQIAQTAPDGTSVTTSYSGNVTTTTDEAGNSWQRTTDGLGRLAQVLEPGSLATNYSYDPLGNLKTVVQHGTGTETARNRSFSYDSLSRLLSSTNPETGTISYGYDADSNLTLKTDARGITTTYSYDVLNRLNFKHYSDSTHTEAFGYDGNNELGTPLSQSGITSNNAVGRLSIEDNQTDAGSAFSYDSMGRLQSESIYLPSVGAWTTPVAALYDLAGNMTTLTYPDGRLIQQTFDGAGRLSTSNLVAVNGVSAAASYLQAMTYFPDGSPSQMTLGNGVVQSITKNNRLQVQSMSAQNAAAPFNNQQFLSHTYSYANTLNPEAGNNGNIWGIADTLNGSRSQSFTYDGLNRISSFNLGGALNQSYGTDSFGNMTQMAGSNPVLTFDPATNRISNLPCASTVQGFDAAGNQLCDTDQNGAISQRSFDAESRISQIAAINSGASPFVMYTYGADGARVRKTNADGTFTEYVDFGGQPIAEKDQNGNWTDYIYANGKKIAMVQAVKPTIHIHGVQGQGAFGGCGTPFYVTGQTSGIFGYVVQQGDVLSFDHKAVSALSGVWLALGNGTYANSNSTTDVTDTAPDGKWHHTSLDLSNFSGQTVTAVIMGPGNPNTPVGPWDAWVANFSIVSADGGVHPVYTGGTATGSAWGNCGGADTNLTLASEVTQVDSVVGTTYYLGDHLGTAQMEFASGGWPLYLGQFAPFGGEIQNGAALPPNMPDGSANHYKFTGKERDAESGLDYFGARYYGSSMGRWMSPDWADKPEAVPYSSLGNPQSLNLYGYVGNNPLSQVDADGHEFDGGWNTKPGSDEFASGDSLQDENHNSGAEIAHNGFMAAVNQSYADRAAAQQQPSGMGPGTPNVPIPGGKEGQTWKWVPNDADSRGGTYRPTDWDWKSQGNQPSVNWDNDPGPKGVDHWDLKSGPKGPQKTDRFDEHGNSLTPEQAHGQQPRPTASQMGDSVRRILQNIRDDFWNAMKARYGPCSCNQ